MAGRNSREQELEKINIKTFVIFDIETTGLRSGKEEPKITELCLLALSREQLMRENNLRVVSCKLLMCFNPEETLISPKASEISGLRNEDLKCMRPFGQQASLVCTFLQNLSRPACLIAHNGNRFDFPVLISELQACGEEVPAIHCADSLEALRMLDGLPRVGGRGDGGYNFSEVYERTFERPPLAAHTAEGDCSALLEIIQKKSPEFVTWCDTNATYLRDISKEGK